MSDSASRRKLARAAHRLAAAARSPLPPLVLMTDEDRLPDPVGAAQNLPRGCLVIVRARQDAKRRFLANALGDVARSRGLFLSIAGDFTLALATKADGIHLPESRIGEAAALHARHRFLVTASAHSLAALRRAEGVDALLFSPVFATRSHPGRSWLGAVRANHMARLCPMPVYALGGITADNAPRLSGFAGIAAIGALAV